MIPLTKPHIGINEAEAAKKVILSGYLAQGPYVAKLEKKFATLCGTNYAIAVNSGTAALHTALYALKIKPGDEVITTPFTFVATANAILMVGARPVFVDIEPDTFNIDPEKIEQAITPKTKAILAVNLFGQPANYTKIHRIAKKYHLKVIEDAAQSVNASYTNKKSGNLADIACFSFYATKNIMCGEGGMITTNSKKYYEYAKMFRNHGQIEGEKYIYKDLGFNYRLNDVLATVALEQLKKITDITQKRQASAALYRKGLNDIKGLILPVTATDCSHVFHQYTIQVTKDCKTKRDQLQYLLKQEDIQTNIYYPIALYSFSHLKQGKKTFYPITELVTKQCLSLPIYPDLKKKEKKYIIETIRKLTT